MNILKKEVLLASTLLLLGSAFQTSSAEDKMDVIVKLKAPLQTFSTSAQSKNAMQVSQFRIEQSKLRRSKLKTFVSQKKIKTKHLYDNVYNGFSASLTQSEIDDLKRDPNVSDVFEDKMFYINPKNKAQRTTKRKRKLIDWPQVIPQAPIESGSSVSAFTGEGQHVYVIDTGIDVKQADISANLGLSYAPEFCHWPANKKLCPMPFSDDNGHGTHVAGTVAALNNDINALGMAPNATIHAVKVCNYEGGCPGSSILAGLNWAVFDMLGHGQPAVANLSLGGATDLESGVCTDTGYVGENFVAEAYCNAAHQGMIIVVAAGNSSEDAATHEPSAFNSTISVSSYTSYDELTGEAVFTYFSNYGEGDNEWGDRSSGAVTIAAPGDSIVSLNRTHAVTTLSGTSMASPAVAGAVAMILEKHPQSLDYSALQNVRQMLVDNATIPTVYSTQNDPDGVELNLPHEEGLLNVRFLDE